MSAHFSLKKLTQVVDLLAAHKENPSRYPFLLESVATGDKNCDYSILFAFPQAQIALTELNTLHSEGVDLDSNQFLDSLNQWFSCDTKQVPATIKQKLPFYGGWFVYLGYELSQEIEPVLQAHTSSHAASEIDLPLAMATRIPAAIIVNKKHNETWIVAEPGFENLLEQITQDIQCKSPQDWQGLKQRNIIEEAPARYTDAVERIQQYIVDGDVFQVNISRQWQIQLDRDYSPATVYAQLRKSNPAPFAGLMVLDAAAVISSSPERLVSVRNGQVETRPIAGTRPRSRTLSGEIDTNADEALRQELINHPKERAEHVMLIDLERNDLGRICRPGSIEVDELMGLETYEHVHHIVSNVKGQIAGNILPGDVIKAVFPGGTITGCPKVRCMEIIAELEASPRQAYTGSMGYVNIDGDMDFNILIRTIIHAANQLHIRAGAGIVAYSDAEKELQETRIKARGMLKVIGSEQK